LAWITGAAVMAGGSMPSGKSMTLAALYSAGAHGIMTLNDFKSIVGDRQMGVRSLPVQLGVDAACRVACACMVVPQILVVLLLIGWQRPAAGGAVALITLLQIVLMDRLLEDPRERATWYSGTGVTLYVIGMLVSAMAVRATA